MRALVIGILSLLFIGICPGKEVIAQGGSYEKVRISEKSDGKITYQWVDGGYSLSIELEGDVEWSDDDKGIKSISRNGYIEIEEKTRRNRQRLVVEQAPNGDLKYEYRKNRKRAEFDEDAREWLAEVLSEVIRESGIGAEARVQRILDREGVDGVFDEIKNIERPWAKTLYLLHLLELAELTGNELVKAAELAVSISAPGDKSRFLKTTAKMFLMHDEAVGAYFDAVESITSPGDKTRVLIHLVEQDLLNDEVAYRVALETARTITSPGDKARFMQRAVPFFVPAATDEYFDAVNTISSPGDHARVLSALLESKELDTTVLLPMLDSVQRISSPGDKARVLTRVADWMDENGTTEKAIERYLETSETISSPGDRSRVLIHVFDATDMNDEAVLKWLDSVETISSPGDKARVLMRASDRVADNDTLVDAYLETAETISSPGDRRRVLAALID